MSAESKLKSPPLPPADPCVIVVFGATGDLTERLLIPALYNLGCEGCTHERFEVLGVGRGPMSDEAFRNKLQEGAKRSKDTRNYDEEKWRRFAKRLTYMAADSSDRQAYFQIAERLRAIQKE